MYHAHGRKTGDAVAGKPDAVKAACPVWRGAHGTGPPTRWHLAGCLPDGDIKGCFDHIDHQVLMDILARDIKDGRVLNLIQRSLDAGVLEDWVYYNTYSGTPQGGVLSPLLSNIYLHELDTFIEDTLIPRYTRGSRRKINREYARLGREMSKAKARNDGQTVKRLQQERRTCPSQDTHDPNYRRLSYVRYADDFLLGFIGTKAEAEAIKEAIGTFLRDRLHLTMSAEKTLITHARTEQARFLNYAISINHADDKVAKRATTGVRVRSINGGVRLGIPQGLIHQKAAPYQRHGKPVSEKRLTEWSEAWIIDTYQQRFRGLAEYYKFAVDRSDLCLVKHVMEVALVKTLAQKLRISVSTVYQKFRGTCRVGDQDYKTLQVCVPTKKGERIFTWGAIPLKTVTPGTASLEDNIPVEYHRGARADLIRRLLADTCELCGSQVNCEVHHVRKLADLKKRWAGRREKPVWVRKMVMIRRKTLIVCRRCHVAIHNGTFDLPKA